MQISFPTQDGASCDVCVSTVIFRWTVWWRTSRLVSLWSISVGRRRNWSNSFCFDFKRYCSQRNHKVYVCLQTGKNYSRFKFSPTKDWMAKRTASLLKEYGVNRTSSSLHHNGMTSRTVRFSKQSKDNWTFWSLDHDRMSWRTVTFSK